MVMKTIGKDYNDRRIMYDRCTNEVEILKTEK